MQAIYLHCNIVGIAGVPVERVHTVTKWFWFFVSFHCTCFCYVLAHWKFCCMQYCIAIVTLCQFALPKPICLHCDIARISVNHVHTVTKFFWCLFSFHCKCFCCVRAYWTLCCTQYCIVIVTLNIVSLCITSTVNFTIGVIREICIVFILIFFVTYLCIEHWVALHYYQH